MVKRENLGHLGLVPTDVNISHTYVICHMTSPYCIGPVAVLFTMCVAVRTTLNVAAADSERRAPRRLSPFSLLGVRCALAYLVSIG